MADSHGPAGRGSTLRTALIAFATFVGGALGGYLLRADERTPEPATGDDARSAGELAAELASLRAEIDRLRRVVEGASPNLAGPPVETRRESAASSADLEAVVARFERAVAALERSAPASSRPPVPGQGRASIAAIQGEVTARWNEDHDLLFEDLSRAHYLWTVDEVLARYGMPNLRQGADELNLHYGLGGDASEAPNQYVEFQVRDGRVTGVYVETD